jgi:hypothetical protein
MNTISGDKTQLQGTTGQGRYLLPSLEEVD